MILSWRKHRAARRAAKKRYSEENGSVELTLPAHFRCPISLDLMKDPVTLSTGITYDRESIETWIDAGNRTCPITNRVLTSTDPIPNHSIRKMIQEWCVENRSHGVERISTPRIPVSSYEVSELMLRVAAARESRDGEACREAAAKIMEKMKESERNRRCFAANGTAEVFAAAFESFAEEGPADRNVAVLDEIVTSLSTMLPFDEQTTSFMASPASLRRMVWSLKCGNLSQRRNSILVIKEVVSSDWKKADDLSEIEGSIESIFKLIEEPICPASTKAALITISHLISSSSSSDNKIVETFAEMGLVELLLETLVSSDRSVSEKSLCILDAITEHEKVRQRTRENALTIPVLVKKILRVSDLATELSVLLLWKLRENHGEESDGAGVLVEALQVGAFQKMLLLLQVGCGDRTKEKATELLKMMNVHRERVECIDSMDFKNLKRPF